MTRRGLLAALLAAAGCAGDPATPPREYFPDMVDAVSYQAFAPNPVTRDGKTAMAPAPNTVARGTTPFRYDAGPGDAGRAGRDLKNPFEATPEVLARGRKVFETFCVPCHGPTGQGDGPVIAQFSKPKPLTGENARGLPDGHLFHIITRGQNLMPPHAAQVRPADRWKVVHHIRSLQGATDAGGQP